MTTIYTASWVLPITSEPIQDGAVAVSGQRIAAVGAREDVLRRFREATVHDFKEAAILPGLVNCHTHLELTCMRGYLEREEENFFAWLAKLTRARNEVMSEEDRFVSAAWGAVEAARAGVTAVGDASDAAGPVMRALREVGLRGVVFQEVFGPDPQTARERFDGLSVKVEELRADETALVKLGVSPHAPYTVSAPLLRLVSDFAIAESFPLMIHAAESEAEELFMREGHGPFAEGLRFRGIVWEAPRTSSIRYLEDCGVLSAHPLLAHCIRIDERDAEAIRNAGAHVAHCPKSNAKFGHGRAPLGLLLGKGVEVGLGSDSVASNNTCDILEEARFALLASRAAGERVEDERMLSANAMLRAATVGGARGLSDASTGALVEGQQADLAVFSLEGVHQSPVYDPAAALVFASSGRDALLTVVAGREVFRYGRVTTVDEHDLRRRINDLARRLASV